MIYIFDDRPVRRSTNEKNLFNKYSYCVSFVDLKPGQTLEAWASEVIGDADCICIHKSYKFKDITETLESAIEHLKALKAPIVIFSGGTERSNKGLDKINQINADQMYVNMPFFLDDFKQTGKSNIDILLWGEMTGLNAILNFQNKLAKEYLIQTDDLNNQIKNLDEVFEFIESEDSLPQNFINDFLSAVSNRKFLTWQGLADILDETVRKFK